MDQDNRLQELDEIKPALAVLSVQLAIRRSSHFLAPPDRPAEKVDQTLLCELCLP
jgi:hypothetical protein